MLLLAVLLRFIVYAFVCFAYSQNLCKLFIMLIHFLLLEKFLFYFSDT